MFGSTPAPAHPILGCARRIATLLSEVAEVDALYMTPGDKATALLAVQRDLDRLAELQLAHHARLDRGDARHRQALARSLDASWHRLAGRCATAPSPSTRPTSSPGHSTTSPTTSTPPSGSRPRSI